MSPPPQVRSPLLSDAWADGAAVPSPRSLRLSRDKQAGANEAPRGLSTSSIPPTTPPSAIPTPDGGGGGGLVATEVQKVARARTAPDQWRR